MNVRKIKEQLENELAEIMLLAIREQAGIFLTGDEFAKAKSQLAETISCWRFHP